MLSFVSLFFVVSILPPVWCYFVLPCWLCTASLHTLLSPGVLLSSFSTKGTISSQRGSGDCHLSAGVQDEKRAQNSSVKWGTEVTWASKPPPALRNSSPKAVQGPPQCCPPMSPAWCHGVRQHRGYSQNLRPRLKMLPVGLVATLQSRCHYSLPCPGQSRTKKTKVPLALGKEVSSSFSPHQWWPQLHHLPPKTNILPKHRQLRFEGLLAGMTGVVGRCGLSFTALLCKMHRSDAGFAQAQTHPQPTVTRGLINKLRRLVIASNKQLSVFC